MDWLEIMPHRGWKDGSVDKALTTQSSDPQYPYRSVT